MREAFRAVNTILLWLLGVYGVLAVGLQGVHGWLAAISDPAAPQRWWEWFDRTDALFWQTAIGVSALLVGNLLAARPEGRARARRITFALLNLAALTWLAMMAVMALVAARRGADVVVFGRLTFATPSDWTIALLLAGAGLALFFGVALLMPWPPEAPPEPEQRALPPRVDSLDLLRGFAILGIFVMNTQSMLLKAGAYVNPTVIDYTGWNVCTYWFTHLTADMKCITIFSFMFGAGIMLQGERVASRGMSPALTHYLRMAVLLVFGLIHAYGIWYGDILTAYACCGLLFFPLRKLPAGLLLALGFIFILAEVPISLAASDVDALAPPARYTPASLLFQLKEWQSFNSGLYGKLPDGAQSEETADRGLWRDELRYRAVTSLDEQTYTFATWTFWRCGGAILVGMALQRWRFFHGAWGRPAYWTLALFGILSGVTLSALGIYYNTELIEWDEKKLWAFGMFFNYFGSLAEALGYMCVGVLVAQRIAAPGGAGVRLLKYAVIPIRAVGKTALSNYLFQSLVGTTLAYAHAMPGGAHFGFGLFGAVERVGLLPIVLAVWAVQLMVSTIWTHFFRQGPAEWLWHSLVYLGRSYPLRPAEEPRSTAVAVEAG